MSKTADQLRKLLEDENYFKFLWAMYDEILEADRNFTGTDHTGTIIGRYASHLEASKTSLSKESEKQ